MHLLKFLLIGQICSTHSLLSLCRQPGGVDRLVSRRHEKQLRDVGFANGGNSHRGGGILEDRQNFELSFYHINDVHA